MSGVLVLAGPPAVGHNTVAELWAAGPEPVVVVDGDDVRAPTQTADAVRLLTS